MANPNISEIAALTIESRSRKLADNVSDNNALLKRLKMRGNMRTFSGGTEILEELAYAENSTYTRYSGYEPVNVQPSNEFTAASFDMKQVSIAITVSGREMLQNSGREKMIDLMTARITNAERTMMNGLSTDIYSDGTADGSKQIGGLASLVASAPATGTVGGINRANHTFWRNQTEGGLAAGNVKEKMQALWLKTCRGADKPDIIVADNVAYGYYWDSLTDLQRFSSVGGEGKAGFGFPSLQFEGNCDVVLDGGIGGNAPSTTMHFLNTSYIHWRPHKDRNMRSDPNKRYATNQDANVQLLLWAGNMTLSCAFLQGRLGA